MTYSKTFHWSNTSPSTVVVTGSFDEWKSTVNLTKGEDGFSADVPLNLGEKVLYKYVVDGVWQHNPSEDSEVDLSGNTNNVFHVPSTAAEPFKTETEAPVAAASVVAPPSTSATNGPSAPSTLSRVEHKGQATEPVTSALSAKAVSGSMPAPAPEVEVQPTTTSPTVPESVTVPDEKPPDPTLTPAPVTSEDQQSSPTVPLGENVAIAIPNGDIAPDTSDQPKEIETPAPFVPVQLVEEAAKPKEVSAPTIESVQEINKPDGDVKVEKPTPSTPVKAAATPEATPDFKTAPSTPSTGTPKQKKSGFIHKMKAAFSPSKPKTK